MRSSATSSSNRRWPRATSRITSQHQRSPRTSVAAATAQAGSVERARRAMGGIVVGSQKELTRLGREEAGKVRAAPTWLKLLLAGQAPGAAGDRVGHRRALAGALAGWAACCLAFLVAPAAALAPLALLAGLASGAVRPLMYSVVVTALPADRRREGIALSRAAINAGTVVGPPLGGLLAATDFGAIFVADALTSLALLAVVLRVVPVAEPTGAAAEVRDGGVLRALRTD